MSISPRLADQLNIGSMRVTTNNFYLKRRNAMFNEERPLTVSEVGSDFSTFFDRVRWLYNLHFLKEEKSNKVKDVERYADELFHANRISDYIYSIIGEGIKKFSLLLIGKIKKMEPSEVQKLLNNLDKWISISISDINSEISELMPH